MKMTSFAATVPATFSGMVAAQLPGLAEYGTSWPIVAASLVGAVTAIPDLPQNTRIKVAAAVVLALFFGALGAPVAGEYVATKFGIGHAALPLLLALLMAHFAHDVFRPVIAALLGFLSKKGDK